jgi:hypothetical protein
MIMNLFQPGKPCYNHEKIIVIFTKLDNQLYHLLITLV